MSDDEQQTPPSNDDAVPALDPSDSDQVHPIRSPRVGKELYQTFVQHNRDRKEQIETARHEIVEDRYGDVRRTLPWLRVLGLMVLAFALWLVFNATTLQHNADASPVGTRRSVALTLLRPVAATSRFLQVSRIESTANGLLGRNGNGLGHGSLIVVGPGKLSRTTTKSKSSTHVTTTTLDPTTHPSSAAPLRVLILGDSLGLDLGGSLQNQLANTGVVTATLDGKESTGLTRPDYFNWPAELANDLPAARPQVVVAMMGANDPQDFPGPPDIPFGTAQWSQQYEANVISFMKEATSTGASLIWVSIPPMQDPGLNARIATVNALQHQAAVQVKNVTYISSQATLGDSQGNYTPFLTINGQNVNVRTPDGTHITPDGSNLLSNTVIQSMRSQLGILFP